MAYKLTAGSKRWATGHGRGQNEGGPGRGPVSSQRWRIRRHFGAARADVKQAALFTYKHETRPVPRQQTTRRRASTK